MAKVDPAAPAPTNIASDRRQSAAASYGKLPLSFEANHGQTDPEVQFLSRGSGHSLFLTGKGAVLALGTAANPGKTKSPARPQDMIHMTLQGHASQRPIQAAGEDPLPGKVNYFLGSDPTQWHTDLPTYAKVRYSSVYPGIDLVYYGNQRQLEYDFIVAPGARPSDIRFHLAGARHLRIAANGDLLLGGSNIQPAFQKPLIYQESKGQEKDGQRQIVPGSFRLLAVNTVGFTLGSYDHTRPLIIDPVLVYSTYLGGTGAPAFNNYPRGDQANGIAIDTTGNTYLVGTTLSADFPTTKGAYQTKNKAYATGQLANIFVTKLNPQGTALLYSTFIGGSISDNGSAIALDSANNAYITGYSSSPDFPTTKGAYSTTISVDNQPTVIVAELNAAGNGLVYSTYLGQGYGQAIALDAQGNTYLTGYTNAKPGFPVTPGAFQSQCHGTSGDIGIGFCTSNAFVTKLNVGGSALLYSTYLGGSGLFYSGNLGFENLLGDQGKGIAVDSSGNAYIAGGTYSSDFPVTGSAYQPTNHAVTYDGSNAFVTKLNPTGTALLYSTYLGGSGQYVNVTYVPDTNIDAANAIVIDSSGSAYVAGVTNSLDFPVTAGALDDVGDPNDAGFVTKLNATGSALDYSTYIGGGGTAINALAVDSDGKAYVTGPAGTFVPTTTDALPGQTCCAFALKLDAAGSAVEYGTLLGKSSNVVPTAITLGSTGHVYLTGGTTAPDFPTTTGAYQTVNKAAANSSNNAFVTQLALAAETTDSVGSSIQLISSSALLNQGQSLTLTVKVVGGAGATTPGGTVTLSAFSGSAAFATTTLTLNSAGSATWHSSTLPPGAYAIVASYSGDASHVSAYTLSNLQFRVVGPPAQLIEDYGSYSCGYGYCSGLFNTVIVTDVTGYGLQGVTVYLSGADFIFNPPSVVTNQYGFATAKFTPIKAGRFTFTISVPGIATTLNPSIYVAPASLTVTLYSYSRPYGAANPSLAYTLSGLIGSETINVTTSSTATKTSPVGSYPITATLSGADLSNYSPTVSTASLYVVKAPLHIVAAALPIVYGHAPPKPTAYRLTGFLNGDTASVVTGAPALSTTVTATTPVGFYPITVQPGTLSATNYDFLTTSNGPGYVGVYKAPLTLTANTITMTAGSPVPPLTYTLTGFVNGDTASTVSGAPILTTSATATSSPGTYGITVKVGNLSAANYGFVPVENVGVVHVVK